MAQGGPHTFSLILLSCGSYSGLRKKKAELGNKNPGFPGKELQGETTGQGKLRHRKKDLSKTVNSGTAAVSMQPPPKSMSEVCQLSPEYAASRSGTDRY